jgi:hypothetical protein
VAGSINIGTRDEEANHRIAKKLLSDGKVEEAWTVLLNSKF